MQFHLMDPKLIAGVAVILLIVVVGIALYVRRQRTITSRQRGRFGSEYDRAALGQGSKHKAEAKLVDRETRVETEDPRSFPIAFHIGSTAAFM